METKNMLAGFDSSTTSQLREMLQQHHVKLAEIGSEERTITARNYDSAIRALGDYLTEIGEPLPTRSALESWRGSLLKQGKAVSTVNARLAAARKLLRSIAADVTDLQIKMVLESWAGVNDAKKVKVSDTDKTEDDYGLRLTLPELQQVIDSIDKTTLKGLRDRALIALLAGAGLRISEAVKLNMRDVFLTQNKDGQRGIRIRNGKHNKSRVVVLNAWSSWVLEAVQAYTDAIGITPMDSADKRVLRTVRGEKAGFSVRSAQEVVENLKASHKGQPVRLAAHDLRRTYAKISKDAGMSWEALRENLGHSDLLTTQRYVGMDVDWSERVPNWSIRL